MTSDKIYNESTKFDITYSMLQAASKTKYFKPCLKHYLTPHIKSRLALIEAPEWEIATFLPTADFQKASQQKVWADSRRKINQ